MTSLAHLRRASLIALSLSPLTVLANPGAGKSQRPMNPISTLLNAYPRAWRRSGGGLLRFGPFQVYQAQLYVVGATYQEGADAVLDITYRRSLDADSIVNASILEIGRVNTHTPAQLSAWSEAIRKSATPVKADDRLTGVFLRDYGARFFKNDVLVHEVRDPAFSTAYLNIWLSPKAREQRLRTELLGQVAAAQPLGEMAR